jgi:hypothetical protein
VKNKIDKTLITRAARISHTGGAISVVLRNIIIGVKKGVIDKILAICDEGSLMTMKLTMKGMMIRIVTGIDND